MATELARHVALPPIAMIAVCAATIGWRRLSPTTACLVALVALATFEHTGGSRGLQVGPVVGACDYYTLGQRIVERGRRERAAVAVAAAIPVIATAPALTPVVKVVGLFGFFCVIPCAGGVAVAGKRRHATTLAARVAELERRHRAQSEQAAAEERWRSVDETTAWFSLLGASRRLPSPRAVYGRHGISLWAARR